MRQHIDVLGWLHMIWGGFGLLTGTSLLILAGGARQAFASEAYGPGERAAVLLLAGVGGLLMISGLIHVAAGWYLRRLHGFARMAALILAVPAVIIVPFGTALGGYTFWVLLNNDARRTFGRAPRS